MLLSVTIHVARGKLIKQGVTKGLLLKVGGLVLMNSKGSAQKG